MYKYLFLILIAFCGCKNAGENLRAKKLQDTLAKLKLITDFKPLTQADAYAFLNDYYLPHLDSLPVKRKLYIHPLIGIDYKKMFFYAKKELEVKYSDDSLKIVPPAVILAPPQLYNKSFNWDKWKLHNILLIVGNERLPLKNVKTAKVWPNALYYAYMSVSYPIYNAHTNILSITERFEGLTDCGTGRDNIYRFTKTATGWKQL